MPTFVPAGVIQDTFANLAVKRKFKAICLEMVKNNKSRAQKVLVRAPPSTPLKGTLSSLDTVVLSVPVHGTSSMLHSSLADILRCGGPFVIYEKIVGNSVLLHSTSEGLTLKEWLLFLLSLPLLLLLLLLLLFFCCCYFCCCFCCCCCCCCYCDCY